MTPSYALGIAFIILVSVIWSAASILVQYLFQETDFNSPFLLTYIGTSLFIIFIPTRLLWERRYRWRVYLCRKCKILRPRSSSYTDYSNNNETDDDKIIPWKNNDDEFKQSREILQELEQWQYDDSTVNSKDEYSPNTSDTLHENEQMPLAPDVNIPSREHRLLSHIDHIRMAVKIAPLWFCSNYFYNLSLAFTTITSSTVLSSTGSVFTFIFAVTCGDECFSKNKFIGVALAFSGSLITSLQDTFSTDDPAAKSTTDSSNHPIYGDIFGLISAVGYGCYTVMLRVACPQDENIFSMQLLLGYIGLLNMLSLSPVLFYILPKLVQSNENQNDSNMTDDNNLNPDDDDNVVHAFTWFIFACIVVKGLFDNVLSDYLWARSIVLTSATVASVGLGLTIPLALLSDVFIMDETSVLSVGSILGAILVLVGFVFTNLDEADICSTKIDNNEIVQFSSRDDVQDDISLT